MRSRKTVPVHNLKVTRQGKVKRRSVLWRWRQGLYVVGLTMTVGTAGLIWVVGQVELPLDPKQAAENQTSFICAADVQVNCNASNAMVQLHGTEDRVLVSYDQIPAVLRQAVVATEDKDFFEHGGVDPMGIARAAVSDLRGQGVRQGGSTITQQYVKQAYLSSEQTATRKVKEAVMAIKLEQEVSKEEILTRYLNTVYFGRGAYGVQAASRSWFGHDVEALDAGEAAFLAGLLRNPNGADPYRGSAAVAEAARRRRITLDRMAAEGYISATEERALLAVPVDPAANPADPFVQPPAKESTLAQRVKGSQWGSEYFVEYVRQWLVRQFGENAVLGGGLKVYTTLDLNMQKDAFEAVTSTLDQPGDPAAAVVAIDDQGQIKAMMGGRDWSQSKVNLATGDGGSGRQPGSTFKAFALAEAVREGYSIQSILPSPTRIEIPDETCRDQDEAIWKVKGGPGGTNSLVSATKNSINTVYAQLMLRLGPSKVVKMAHDLGVRSKVPAVCSLVLGAGEVSVLDMASAYSTFANQGLRKDPVVVTRVEKPDGEVVRFTPGTEQVLTPDQSAEVTFALREVIDGGSGAAADFGRDAAGKTGTTQGNADSWFVGYTPKLTAAVWMGYPQGQIPMNDVHGQKVLGATFPAEMWRKFMSTATAGFDSGTFPEPDPQLLAGGRILDPPYGRTEVIAEGEVLSPEATTPGTGPGGQPPTSTTVPAATAPRPTSSTSTSAPSRQVAPVTTSPSATASGTG